jgi:hypothetical protein
MTIASRAIRGRPIERPNITFGRRAGVGLDSVVRGRIMLKCWDVGKF